MFGGSVLETFSCYFELKSTLVADELMVGGRNINELKKAFNQHVRWRIVSGPINTENK